MPAGLLLLPAVAANDAARHALMRSAIPLDLPPAWDFYRSAQQEDWASALQLLGIASDPITTYNRFVIAPTAEQLELLRARTTGELRTLVEVAAFNLGLSDTVPECDELNGELLAIALLAKAAAAMEQGAHTSAIPLLQRAVAATRDVSPLFAAQLLGQQATLCRAEPDPLPASAPGFYQEAIALLGDADLTLMKADLWMQLGMCRQECAQGRQDWMSDAVSAYQEVLRSGLAPNEHEELFALAHNNLGLLFLSKRMSEDGRQLSMAIAVQSFREALRICNCEAHPELSASIQLNLANALQYLPSSHPEENLAQAVDLYEELITQHRKAFDPVGYGRLLSNQANALAHLGIFSPALEKLQEARKLFEWHSEPELAGSAMKLTEQIHEQRAVLAGRT